MDEMARCYHRAFDQVGAPAETRARVRALTGEGPAPARGYIRRLSGVMAAAVLALALLGCGTVAAVFGDSIQSWFGHYWEEITGAPMSQGQAAAIGRLSQELGLSQTAGDVTVTVDSATVGDDTFFLLVRVEGMKFSKRHSYRFEELQMEFSPDPLEAGGLGGYGFQQLGVDGDGALLMMMDMGYASYTGFVPDREPLEVELRMAGLTRSGNNDSQVVSDGVWEFSFTLDRSNIPAPIRLGGAVVELPDLEGQLRAVTITDLEVTNTGVRFRCRWEGSEPVREWPSLLLKSGERVSNGGGTGVPLEGGPDMFCSGVWTVPVDLEEAEALEFGGAVIPIP